MRRLFFAAVCLLVGCVSAFGQVPLGEVVYWDCPTFAASGALVNADATPTFKIYEEATDTAIVTGNLTLRTSTTGEYRGTATASSGNGFEVGKWYNVYCYATVATIPGAKVALTFRVVAAETTDGAPKVDVNVIDTDAISAASIAAAAVTKIQTNIVTWTKNTAVSNYPFKLTKAGAGYTGGTSATITCTVSKDGGAFAGCAAGTQAAIAEVSGGWYKTNVAAADMNADIVVFKFSVPTDAAVVPWEQPIAPGR